MRNSEGGHGRRLIVLGVVGRRPLVSDRLAVEQAEEVVDVLGLAGGGEHEPEPAAL
jgi:hypothetical protein